MYGPCQVRLGHLSTWLQRYAPHRPRLPCLSPQLLPPWLALVRVCSPLPSASSIEAESGVCCSPGGSLLTVGELQGSEGPVTAFALQPAQGHAQGAHHAREGQESQHLPGV